MSKLVIAPPFTEDTAILKVRMAENLWNTRDPDKVVLAYSLDTQWRNRDIFINSREEAKLFLKKKWAQELDYRLIKELWTFDKNRLAVRFAYEWHDASNNWFRSYGNENWEFQAEGLMTKRFASINDLPIREEERLFRWNLGERPEDSPSLSELAL